MDDNFKITAIILLSGFSRRMGQDKLLIEINGKPMVVYVFDLLKHSKFFEVISVCRQEEVIRISNEYGFKTVKNYEADKGISSSIRLGVLNSNLANDGYMFFQGDQILLKKSDISKIVNAFLNNKDSIVVPMFDGKPASPCVFPNNLKNELLEIEGDNGGKSVIAIHLDLIHYVDIDSKYGMIDIDCERTLNTVMDILKNGV